MDLASARYGGSVVWCSDEFFAASSNLLSPASPVWKDGEFTDHGKWMDGWETRRRRGEGHDSCIVRLGLPGVIQEVTVDTSYFTGNFPESFSLDATGVSADRLDEADWVEIVPRSELAGDATATFTVANPHRVTHLRLHIYPDGGVARLRVEGDPIPSMHEVCPAEGLVDLAAATLGGEGVDASDAHYAAPANLCSPTDPEGMWDGWETARRRGAGHDWAVVRLGLTGTVESVDVDTRHFKGNAPGWVTLDTALGSGDWEGACDKVAVEADAINRVDLSAPILADRVRLNIYPDGGVARLRVWGRPESTAAVSIRIRYLNALFPQVAGAFFRTACAARRWVDEMVGQRPYPTAEAVIEQAAGAFETLGEPEWLEAFAAHPRIGESKGTQNARGEQMSRGEQAGVDQSDHDLAGRLRDLNQRYEERFGFRYVVRAAGRSGDEMVDLARQRMEHDRAAELEVAAAHQREITMLRLRRMLCIKQEET